MWVLSCTRPAADAAINRLSGSNIPAPGDRAI